MGTSGAPVPDDLAADHGHHRLDVLDLIGRNREVVAVEHDEIGKLARRDRAEIVLLEDEIGVAARVRDQRVLAADGLRVDDVAADHLAGDGERERRERAILIDLERIGAEAPHHAAVLDRRETAASRRRALSNARGGRCRP